MIEVSGLQVQAGGFHLRDVELAVPEGRCHVLVGPTGAGKTVLLETLVGFRSPTDGTLRMDGREMTPLPPAARQIAYLPQDVCLFPHMTVEDNVLYGLRARRMQVNNGHLDRLVDFFAIRDLLPRYPQKLSGGEKQRVALVRALAVQPRLVVMDEPFSAIDATMREETRRLFRRMQQEFGLTTLLVTHDFEEACFLGDQISILIGGRIRQSGDRHSVWNFPKKLDVARFLGIRNVFQADVREAVPGRTTLVWPDERGTLAIACGCGHLRYKSGDSVHWGIRPEAVEVPENGDPDGNNRYRGTIQAAYVRGRHHTLNVSLENGLAVEMDLPARDLRRSGGEPGQVLEFLLPPESIFILEDS